MLIELLKLIIQFAVAYFVIKFVLKSLKGSRGSRRHSVKRTRKASVKSNQYHGEKGDSLVTLLTHKILNYNDNRKSTSQSTQATLKRTFSDSGEEDTPGYSQTILARTSKPAAKNRRLSPWGGTVDSSEEYDVE